MFVNNETPRTNGVELPRDLYIVRCLTAKFGLSKAKNPMTTLECETVSLKDGATVITGPDGTPVQVADQKFKMFLIYTPDQVRKVFDFTEQAIGERLEKLDPENPDTEMYVGKKWYQLLYSSRPIRVDGSNQPILDANDEPLKGPPQIQARLEDASSPAS